MANRGNKPSKEAGGRADPKEQHESDALFKLPLAEFTAARNALSSRLKQAGDSDEAARIKALAKPSISAWAVNQLYWTKRAEFDRLLEAGARLRGAKVTDLRAPLNTRREAVTTLLRAAETLLRDAGHNPASDTMRRIESTLEAVSATDALPGRLTADLTPPGFELLATLFPGGTSPGQPAPSPPAPAKPDKRSEKTARARAARQEAERARDAARERSRIADARLTEARTRFEKAAAAAEEARERAEQMAEQAKTAAEALKAAERAVAKASKEELQ